MSHSLKKKWERFYKKNQPTINKIKTFYYNASDKFVIVYNYVSKFKKLFLAAPVATMAVILAIVNLIKLPALVGIGIQANGEYAFEMLREIAVLAPMLITAICLLLVFVSKRTLTPWMVSLFSLLLPLLILITNTFPA